MMNNGSFGEIDDIDGIGSVNKVVVIGVYEEATNKLLNHELQHLIDSCTGALEEEKDKYYTALIEGSPTRKEAVKKLVKRNMVSAIGVAAVTLGMSYNELDAPPWVRYSILAIGLGVAAIRVLAAKWAAKSEYICEIRCSMNDHEEYLARPWEVRAREAEHNGNEFVSFDFGAIR
ncbi:MAG: hypothetical protein LBL08_02355 [Candidatus Nomurabacteria bacterium]|jgi:hypothetical protein|nr:hypothetical protein [Candidatus Nomurabacteria bacterium]